MNVRLYHSWLSCNYALTSVSCMLVCIACNSIYFCLSDFAHCGSFKSVWCRVAEIQIDFFLHSRPDTNTPNRSLPMGLQVKKTQFSIKSTALFLVLNPRACKSLIFSVCSRTSLFLNIITGLMFGNLFLWTWRLCAVCYHNWPLWEHTRASKNNIVYPSACSCWLLSANLIPQQVCGLGCCRNYAVDLDDSWK